MAALNSSSAIASTIQSVMSNNVAVRYEKSEPPPQSLRDEIALRYRIPLEAARVGTKWLGAATWISEVLFLCAWFAHKGYGALSRESIVRLEQALRLSISRGRITGTFELEPDVFEEFARVMDMHEFQLMTSSLSQLEEGVRLMGVFREAGQTGKARRRTGRA